MNKYDEDWNKSMRSMQGFYFKKKIFELCIALVVLGVCVLVIKWTF